MSKGVKVLLAFLIIALILDLTLIFLQRQQAALRGNEAVVSSQSDSVLNDAENTPEPEVTGAVQVTTGLSEEEMGAMALSEESDENWQDSAD